jgi:hypothetical protein
MPLALLALEVLARRAATKLARQLQSGDLAGI